MPGTSNTHTRALLSWQSILTSDLPAKVIVRALDGVAVSVRLCTLRLLIPVDTYLDQNTCLSWDLQTCSCYSVRRKGSVPRGSERHE